MTTLSQLKTEVLKEFDEKFDVGGFNNILELSSPKVFRKFISSTLDTAVRTAFRETEVKEISEERLPYENSPEIYGNQRLESYKKGNHAALAEKTRKEEEFINS